MCFIYFFNLTNLTTPTWYTKGAVNRKSLGTTGLVSTASTGQLTPAWTKSFHIPLHFSFLPRPSETDNTAHLAFTPCSQHSHPVPHKKPLPVSSAITSISNFAPASSSNSLPLVYRQLLRHVWIAGLLIISKWCYIICLLLQFHNEKLHNLFRY
jgi:hypothetical protein